jgi:DNA-binding CsgD family transcriptional regulator/PAS domain-containing protein
MRLSSNAKTLMMGAGLGIDLCSRAAIVGVVGGMGKASVDIYDENRVASISADIAAAVDAATFGSASWDDVPAVLSRAFPGSWGGLYNMNFPDSRLNFALLHNMDPDFIRPWLEHFAYLNPWAAYWTSAKSGTIALSEDVSPARAYVRTEFYNDWLQPQRVDAAAALKLAGDQGEMVNFLMHFPLARSEAYGKAALEIMARVRGTLERSIDLARLTRAGAGRAVAEAAVVERSRCAAFVLDDNRLLREANQIAVDMFSSGRPVAMRNGRCHLVDHEADGRFGSLLGLLAKGVPAANSRMSFRTAAGIWQLILAPLPVPRSSTGVLSLLSPPRMVLVLVIDLGSKAVHAGDLSALSSIFGLTRAEIAFCRRLLAGDSIADAAGNVGITVESARTRIKSIFYKTGTSRQGELILLLSRLPS